MGTERLDQLVAELLAGLGVSGAPPVNLVAVATALGVDRIELAEMTEEGRLEQRGGRVSVWLRTGAPMQRRRFTLAHELGHLVLADPRRDFTAYRMSAGPDREERFCDAFAAALLLPRTWIIDGFAQRPECLGTVRDLADATGASLSACVVRLREILGWRSSLLYWRKHDHHWALLYCAGVPRGLHHRVTSSPTTREQVEVIAQRSAGGRTVLSLLIAGRAEEVQAEVSSRGAGVLALADLTEAARSTAAGGF